jgi:integrase
MAMWDIRTQDLQDILDQDGLSFSTLEHIRNLFKQMYKYGIQFELVAKDYSQYTQITKENDNVHGVPFTREELSLLWKHKDIPFVDTVLIYCYSGWRINELARMPLDGISLEERTFTGGLKNRYSRDRTVPIHSAIYEMVCRRLNPRFKSLIYHTDEKDISEKDYREHFRSALLACGIQTEHTPHDCRHTFNVLLDSAGVDRVARYKLMGHKGQDINENVYTHKDLGQLREAVEAIKVGSEC